MVGHLFRNPNRPRCLLDLQVGDSHLVEVLFHLRRADWQWYKSNEEKLEEELLDLISNSVIPRMFGETIEEYHAKRNPDAFPSETVGSKNTFSSIKPSDSSKTNKIDKNKRNRGRKKMSAAATAAAKALKENRDEKDVYFAFGEVLQLAYRREPLPSYSRRTIIFEPFDDNQKNDAAVPGNGESSSAAKKELGLYKKYPKLPYRLLIWCSKIDPHNKINPDPAGVGFFRPEMIPITSLFREPKDVDYEDDEEKEGK